MGALPGAFIYPTELQRRFKTEHNPDGWIVRTTDDGEMNADDVKWFKDAKPAILTPEEKQRHERWRSRLNQKLESGK